MSHMVSFGNCQQPLWVTYVSKHQSLSPLWPCEPRLNDFFWVSPKRFTGTLRLGSKWLVLLTISNFVWWVMQVIFPLGCPGEVNGVKYSNFIYTAVRNNSTFIKLLCDWIFEKFINYLNALRFIYLQIKHRTTSAQWFSIAHCN